MSEYSDLFKNRAQKSLLSFYEMETGTVRVIREYDHVIEAPEYTPDGRRLIYNSDGKIFLYDTESTEERELETGEADTCNNDHVLRPDGKVLGVSSGKNGSLDSRIYTVNLETGEVKKAVDVSPSYFHGWSPDGKWMVYCGFRKECPGGGDVYTYSPEEGTEKRLTFSEGLCDGPEFSPDGKKIWFHSVRSGLMQIYRMNPDGSDQEQMTFDEDFNSWFPHLSPDGKRAVYIAYRRGDVEPGEHLPDKNVEIRCINTDGTGERTLVSLFGGQGTINVNSWTPDGSGFAFVSYAW